MGRVVECGFIRIGVDGLRLSVLRGEQRHLSGVIMKAFGFIAVVTAALLLSGCLSIGGHL